MSDILVKFQAIKNDEIGTNNEISNQGVITFTEDKILLGIGNGNIDYADNVKKIIEEKFNNIDSPIYNGSKSTAEITAGLTTFVNSFIFNSETGKLVYIPKNATNIDNVIEIPLTGITVTYAEKYVAGTNITITDREDGMKEISAPNNNFTGFNVYATMPKYKDLFNDTTNLVYFVF